MTKQSEYYYSFEVVRGVIISALHDPNLTFSAAKVLANLIGVHANNKYLTGVDEKGRKVGCYPSIATMASELQISQWSVIQAIKLLLELRYIRIYQSKANNAYQRNEYLIEKHYRTAAEIRAEGKARRQKRGSLSSEEPRKASMKGKKHSAETRARMSAAHKGHRTFEVQFDGSLGRPNDTSLGRSNDPLLGAPNDPLLGRPNTNVEKNNVMNTNVDKERSGFADALLSSTLDGTINSISPNNEVDLSRDTSIDVRSSLKELGSTRKRCALWEIPAEIRMLTDEELGVRSSYDEAPDAYFAERREKMQEQMERLVAENFAAANQTGSTGAMNRGGEPEALRATK